MRRSILVNVLCEMLKNMCSSAAGGVKCQPGTLMSSAAQITCMLVTCMLITCMLISHLLIQSLPRSDVPNDNRGFVYFSFYLVHPNMSTNVVSSCKVDQLLLYNAPSSSLITSLILKSASPDSLISVSLSILLHLSYLNIYFLKFLEGI